MDRRVTQPETITKDNVSGLRRISYGYLLQSSRCLEAILPQVESYDFAIHQLAKQPCSLLTQLNEAPILCWQTVQPENDSDAYQGITARTKPPREQ